MNTNEWNRKDDLPQNTVSKFKNIINNLGIKTSVVSEEKYQDNWFSNRIEIEGLLYVGTNGKGVTPDYTMASALGEFMERLQSGALLGHLYQFGGSQCNKLNINTALRSFKIFFKKVCEEYSESDLKKILELSTTNSKLLEFINLRTNEAYVITDRLVNILCGTNGISAGNTFEEAFVQGMSEVFERYVMQYIYKEEYSDTFKVFEESAYNSLKSYSLIKAIKERRYHVNVIDCSLNGKLPVVGVLLLDPSMSKYYFKLGSDANMDIALQRCITEIFQGNSFDVNFRFKMNDFYSSCYEESDFWFSNIRVLEHTKSEINGTGALPRGFLKCLSQTTTDKRIFVSGIKSNKEISDYMYQCCKNISKDVYITNFTSLGVPCIRILVPDMCASFYYRGNNVCQVIERINTFSQLIYNGQLLSEKALYCLIDILEYPAYTYEFSMTKLLGIVTHEPIAEKYIYNPYLFTAYLAVYLRKFDIAQKYIQIYNRNARINDVISKADNLILLALSKNVPKKDLISYIAPVDTNKSIEHEIENIYSARDIGLKVPKCPLCDECDYMGVCSYDIWKNIQSQINGYGINRCKKEFDNFINRYKK